MKVSSWLFGIGVVVGGLGLAAEADAGGCCWGKISVTVTCCKPVYAAPVVYAAPSHCCGYSTPGCWNAPSTPFIPVACTTCSAPAPAPAPSCCGAMPVYSSEPVVSSVVSPPIISNVVPEGVVVHPAPPTTVVPPMPTVIEPTRIMLPLGQELPRK